MTDNQHIERYIDLDVAITQHVLDFCDANNIDVFLFGGSLMGAMMTNGFMAWDDGIDLAMLRDDFERFIALYQEQPNPALRLNCFETNDQCRHAYAQVQLVGTRFYDGVNNDPIGIDIFPLNDAPEQPDEQRAFLKQVLTTHAAFVNSQPACTDSDKQSPWKDKLHATVRSLLRKPIPRGMLYQRYYETVTQYQNTGTDLVETHDDHNPRLLRKPDLLPVTHLEFQGRQWPVPRHYEDVLRIAHGTGIMPFPDGKGIDDKTLRIDFGQWGDTNPL